MATPYVFDTEVYPNCFVAVFYDIKKDQYHTFGFWEHIDDRKALIAFLKKPGAIFIGYNTIKFDGVILQAIINDPDITHEELVELRDSAIKSPWPLINEANRDFKEIDLIKIWHYDTMGQFTSLKHLEFVFRLKSIKDLPYHFNSLIKTQTAYDNVAKYCKYDVLPTTMHFRKSIEKIKGRRDIKRKLGLDLMNSPDSTIGEGIIIVALEEDAGMHISQFKNQWTNRDKIEVKTLPEPYFKSRQGICKEIIDTHFNTIVLHGVEDPRTKKMLFNLKGNLKSMDWRGLEFTIGFGGIHGCIARGVYESDEEFIIKSADVTSQYPNAVIGWNIFPRHLGPNFVKVFKNKVYNERAKYPKKTAYSMNQLYKLGCNAAVGKFKSPHSPLYDPQCNVQVTVNCQLSILSLAEDITDAIPDSQLLMLNTDGLEVRIPRSAEKTYVNICKQWEKNVNFQLEHVDYEKLVIYNVNAYIAVAKDGDVKRKGLFSIYEDYIKREEYHRNTSATIIAQALNDYFVLGVPIEDTVNNCDDIFEFAYGVKKTKAFKYALLIADINRAITIKKYSERVFRYYVSNSPKSGCLFKLWGDGRLTAVNKGDLIMPCLTLRSKHASKYTDLDREYYIQKAHTIRSEIEY